MGTKDAEKSAINAQKLQFKTEKRWVIRLTSFQRWAPSAFYKPGNSTQTPAELPSNAEMQREAS